MASVVSDARASDLKKAQENIGRLERRIECLKLINPNSLSDEKIKEFAEEVMTWYPVYVIYGRHLSNSLLHRSLSITILAKVKEEMAEKGKNEAEKDMKKFKEFLETDIRREIDDLTTRILHDKQFIQTFRS